MTRLERVREFVVSHYLDSSESGTGIGVNAQTVADALSINRSDASSDLNKLWRSGILRKRGKKPVLYFPVLEDEQSSPPLTVSVDSTTNTNTSGNQQHYSNEPLASVIGANGSLKAQIQLAKAAVTYPPNGLHTLITGESGVGKSLLAEEMWRYGVKKGAFSSIHETSPSFIVFSCADYADNPQLLLSQIFGHVKGAFSGANEEKIGLVKKAEGGVLFLDEIHRLPPTGQELFFTLLDKGVYRRLGDTKEIKASLMIIGATTEDPNSVLLGTFRRRIPVIIQLPKLSERPPYERYLLIKHFLTQESNRLQLPIWVSGRAAQVLLSYNCRANVGDLKNDLQLCCARSFLSYLTLRESGDPQHMLRIDIQDLPQKIYSAFQDFDLPDEGVISEVLLKGIMVKPGENHTYESIADDYEVPIDLYGFVQKRLDSYKSARKEDMETNIGRELERYYYASVQALSGRRNNWESPPAGILTPAIWDEANEVLATASKSLDRFYSRSMTVALALHLQQFIERTKSGQIIYNPYLQHIKTKYPEEFEAASSAVLKIAQRFGVSVPEDEIGFLAMFFTQPVKEERQQRIGLVIAAHGRATASSMAEVVNHLLSTNHVHSVDAPLNWSLSEIFEDLCRVVKDSDQEKGVLIIADMGSFVEMESDLIRKTGIQCRVILNASTILALEACKVVLTSNADLDEVVNTVAVSSENYIKSLNASQKDKLNVHRKADITEYRKAGSRGAVITVCPSGAGVAGKIREILLEKLPIARVMDIYPISALNDVEALATKLGNRLRLVIGSINPGLSGTPFVSIHRALSDTGLHEIDIILKGWDTGQLAPKLPEKNYSREQALALIKRQLTAFAPSLAPNALMPQCLYIIEAIESQIYQKTVPVDVVVRICLHAACMFERITIGDTLPMPTWANAIKKQRLEEYNLMYSIVTTAASALRLNIMDTEICYFLASIPERDS